MIPISINNYHTCSDLTQIYLPPRPEPRRVTRPLHPGADNRPQSPAFGGTRPLNWPGRC